MKKRIYLTQGAIKKASWYCMLHNYFMLLEDTINGIKVKIPHNATVRADGSLEYTGTFNGTLGAAQFTNDPAWCLYDLLTSSRYGLGSHLAESDLDKFSFYQASVYCSAQVDDGTGTGNTEPRFSCNVTINSQREAYNVINQMCSVFRSMPYWSAGSLTITQDSPKDSSYLFSLANVLEPGFSYSNVSQKARPTVVIAKYLDLELRDINYVEQIDTANQARYGSVIKNIDAFATTSRGQASRLAKWMLYMSNVERSVVTFSCGIEAGVVVRPGQIIEIADPLKSGERRIIAVGSGFSSKNSRSRESSKLLTYGLTNFDLVEIAKSNEVFTNIDVWLGKQNMVEAYLKEDVYKIIKKGQKKKLKIKVLYNGPIEAPIKKDQILANLKIIYRNLKWHMQN